MRTRSWLLVTRSSLRQPFFIAATLLRTGADQIENFSSYSLLSAAVVVSIDAVVGQLGATVARIRSASQLRACANDLSAGAGLVSVEAPKYSLS